MATTNITRYSTSSDKVAHWRFDGALTSSVGSFTLTSAGSNVYRSLGGGLRGRVFDGTNNCTRGTTDASLNITGSMTVSLVIAVPTVVGSNTVLWTMGDGADGGAGNSVAHQLFMASGNVLTSFWETTNGNVNISTTHALCTLPVGAPTMIHWVRTTGATSDLALYINGESIATATGLTNPDTTSSAIFKVGSDKVGGLNLVAGTVVANLWVANTAWSAASILADYNRVLGGLRGYID